MQTRHIGSLEVSVVGLGCNNFGGRLDSAATATVVHAALDAGVTLFDTADIYGGTRSEEYLGAALGSRRDEVVLASKFGIPYEGHEGGAGAPSVARAVEHSLRRLGTDRIDLYQLHFPDPKVPLAETLGALGDLVTAGKVREVGCSNFDTALLDEARIVSAGGETDPVPPKFVSVQNQYNLFHREPEASVLPWCRAEGMAFLPYFPLANGLLTGKYQAGRPAPEGTRIGGMPTDQAERILTERSLQRAEALSMLAEDMGHSLLELAFGWLCAHREVASVIAGATSAEQIRANVAAGEWVIPDDLMAQIDKISPAG